MNRVMALLMFTSVGYVGLELPDTAPGTQTESITDERVRPSVRVVPQLTYEPNGWIDPTGRFAVAQPTRFSLTGLRIVDLKHRRVAWNIEESPPRVFTGVAFSSDGKSLILSSLAGGEIRDLVNDQATPAPWLRGAVPIYSPDDQLIYLAAHSASFEKMDSVTGGFGYVDRVMVFDLAGKQLESYQLEMNLVGRMHFSNDGDTLIVTGGRGVGLSTRGGGTITPMRQSISVKTGESAIIDPSTAQEGSHFGSALFPLIPGINWDSLPEPNRNFRQLFERLIWDEFTRSFVVRSHGMPEGGGIKSWNVNKAEFGTTLGNGNSLTLPERLRPGWLIAKSSIECKFLPAELSHLPPRPNSPYVPVATKISLPGGPSRPLAISANYWTRIQPNPDGRHIAALVRNPARSSITDRLQIWETEEVRQTGEIGEAGHKIHGFEWVASGQFLMVLRERGYGVLFWECFDLNGQSQYALDVGPWDAQFSPSGELMATLDWGGLQGGPSAQRSRVRVLRLGALVATFDSRSISSKFRFVDEDHLLIADIVAGGSVRVVRIKDEMTLWETEVTEPVYDISWEPDWNAVVLHERGVRSTVLSMSDGRQLPDAGHHTDRWRKPTFLNQGRLALDPLFGTNIIELRTTATGESIATFAAFAHPEWIIYTPDGCWTGSSGVLNWVSFYRGTEPLSRDEIKDLWQPEKIQARVAEAFR